MKTFIAALGASLMLANAAIAEPGDCSTAEVHYVARGFAGFTVGNIVGRCARMHPSIETQMRNAINGFVQKQCTLFRRCGAGFHDGVRDYAPRPRQATAC